MVNVAAMPPTLKWISRKTKEDFGHNGFFFIATKYITISIDEDEWICF